MGRRGPAAVEPFGPSRDPPRPTKNRGNMGPVWVAYADGASFYKSFLGNGSTVYICRRAVCRCFFSPVYKLLILPRPPGPPMPGHRKIRTCVGLGSKTDLSPPDQSRFSAIAHRIGTGQRRTGTRRSCWCKRRKQSPSASHANKKSDPLLQSIWIYCF